MQINRPLALALCLGATASAAVPAADARTSAQKRIFADLTDGKLKHCYTTKQLKKARSKISRDADQYSPSTRKAINKEIRYTKSHRVNTKRAACR